MSLGERLRAARIYAGLTQVELAEKSGVPQQNISSIEQNKQDKSADIVQLAIACGVRSEWLALESGEMLDKPTFVFSEPTARIAQRLETLSPREQYRVAKLIDAYLEPADNDGQRTEPNQGQQ